MPQFLRMFHYDNRVVLMKKNRGIQQPSNVGTHLLMISTTRRKDHIFERPIDVGLAQNPMEQVCHRDLWQPVYCHCLFAGPYRVSFSWRTESVLC